MKAKIVILLIAVFAMVVKIIMVPNIITYAFAIPAKIVKRQNAWGVQFKEDARYCLAQNIYFEARGEPLRGQYAVADVVLYRVINSHYDNTVCGVVREGHYYTWNTTIPIKHRCNFSWFCDGKSDNPKNRKAFKLALELASEVLYDPYYKPHIEYSLFYHSSKVLPNWAKSRHFVEKVGKHYFYK